MKEKYCQSCGMPMHQAAATYGSEVDGTLSKEYCEHCYKDGKFSSECSMEQMIDFCVPFMLNETMDEQKARSMMNEVFPTLKRWIVQ